MISDLSISLSFMIFVFEKQVTAAYNNDPSPVKVNLGVGAYRTEVIFLVFCLNFSKHLYIIAMIRLSHFCKLRF